MTLNKYVDAGAVQASAHSRSTPGTAALVVRGSKNHKLSSTVRQLVFYFLTIQILKSETSWKKS